jgi:PAS domain S-box-containing protein
MLTIWKLLRRLWPRKIRYQLVCGVALVHLFLMTVFVVDLVARQREFLKQRSLEQTDGLVRTLAVNSTSWVLANDVVGLEEIVQSIRQYPNLRYGMVVTRDGQVLAHTDAACVGTFVSDDISRRLLQAEPRPQTLLRDGRLLDVAAPVLAPTGKLLAWARVGQGQEEIWQSLSVVSRNGVFYTLMAIGVGSVFAVLIGNRLTSGLNRLLYVSGQIRDGHRDLRMATSRTDEVSRLGEGINEMLEAITSGEHEREALIELLHLLNTSDNMHALLRSTTTLLSRIADCEAVGVRLRSGDDCPYYETRGFPAEFVRREDRLCAADERGELVRDSAGNPVLECMCGNVLCGRFDPAKPFFTARGSFWTNCTTELLARTTEFELQARTRNRCNGEGYESVALLPLHVGESTIGLLQFNDHRRGRFTPEIVAMLERFAGHLAIGVAQRRAAAELRESEDCYRTVADFTYDWECWIAPDDTLRYCSPACERITGYRAEEFTRRPALLIDIVHPDDRDRVASHHRQSPHEGAAPAELEYRIRRSDGEERWIAHVCQPVRGRDGSDLGRRASNRDITERKRTEEALRASEARFRSIFESAVVGVTVRDLEGRVLQANPAYERLAGCTVEELRAGALAAVLHPDDAPHYQQVLVEIAAGSRDAFVFEKRLLRKDGSVIWGRVSGAVVKHSDGTPRFVVSMVEDITERKRIERVNMARLRLIQFAATHSLDELLEASLNEAEELTGSLIGFYHFVEADQQTLLLQNWSTRTKAAFCTAEGKGLHYPISEAGVWVDCVHQRRPVIHNDYASLPHRKGMPPGHAPVVRELVVPVLRGDQIVAILGVGNKPHDYGPEDVETVSLLADLAWDVAGRMRAESELRRANRALRALSDCNQAVIRATDEAELLAAVCRVAVGSGEYRAAWIGYAEEDAACSLRPVAQAGFEMGVLEALEISWADAEHGQGTMSRAIRTGVAQAARQAADDPVLTWWRGREATAAPACSLSLPLRMSGKLLGTLTIYADTGDAFDARETGLLTEMADDLAYGIETLRTRCARARAEADLRLFRRLTNQSSDAIFVVEPGTGRLLDANDTAARVLGYSRDELLNLHVTDFDPGMREQWRWSEHVQAVRAAGSQTLESRHQRKDGTTFPVEVSVSYSVQDRKDYLIAAVRDITERKRAQDELQQSNELLRAVIQAAPTAIIGLDLDGNVQTVWNPAAERMLGWRAPEVMGRPLPTVPAESREEFVGFREQVRCGLNLDGVEVRRQKRDGTPIDYCIYASPLRDPQGNITGNVAVLVDVTERKRAEELLHRREQEFRALVENSQDIIARYDRNCQRTYVNPAYLKATAIPPPELLGSTPAQRSPLAPNDAAALQNLLRNVLASGHPAAIDLPLRRADGARLWFNIHGVPELDQAGHVVGVLSISRDITARKLAEQHLQRLNRELRALSNCNETLMRAVDEQTLLNDICHIVCDVAGYRMAWVGLAEHDAAQSVRPTAWAGVEDGYLASANISWADTERGRGPTGTAIRTGTSVCLQDFATSPEAAPWREQALQCGYRSSIVLPLKDEHASVVGALNIYSAEPNAFTTDEVRLLEELAGDLSFGITVLRTRAERERAEAELRAKTEELHHFFNLSLDLLCIADTDGRFTRLNPSWERVLGYPLAELQVSRFFEFIHPDDVVPTQEAITTLAAQHGVTDFVNRYRCADGSYRWLEWRSAPVGQRIYAVARDITERRQAEATLLRSERQKTILNQIASIVLTVPDEDMYGDVLAVLLDVLGSEHGVFGYIAENEDLIIPSLSREAWDRCRVSNKSTVFPQSSWGDSLWGRAIHEKASFVSEGPFRTPPGHLPLVNFLATPIVFGDRSIGLLSVANRTGGYGRGEVALLETIGEYLAPILNARLQRDRHEQERRHAEERVAAQLREKELLLREIHHRVKNNMQVISSLLDLQARQAESQQFRELLTASRGRIRTMALVHERLYAAQDMARVDLREYIQALVAESLTLYGVDPGQVAVHVNVEPWALAIPTAIPCGLIIHELLSNALRHAFPGGRPGRIEIVLARTAGGVVELSVEDNGVGLPEGLTPGTASSLGLRLVQILATDQLGGAVQLERGQGTRIHVRFAEAQS